MSQKNLYGFVWQWSHVRGMTVRSAVCVCMCVCCAYVCACVVCVDMCVSVLGTCMCMHVCAYVRACVWTSGMKEWIWCWRCAPSLRHYCVKVLWCCIQASWPLWSVHLLQQPPVVALHYMMEFDCTHFLLDSNKHITFPHKGYLLYTFFVL